MGGGGGGGEGGDRSILKHRTEGISKVQQNQRGKCPLCIKIILALIAVKYMIFKSYKHKVQIKF